MSTSMHRLQVSLPRWQVQFLSERAHRNRTSVAEVIRQMVQREAEAQPADANVESLLEIAGMAESHSPLIDGIPVSERPDLYLASLAAPAATPKKPGARRPLSRARQPRRKAKR
jgi:hypothetical protein